MSLTFVRQLNRANGSTGIDGAGEPWNLTLSTEPVYCKKPACLGHPATCSECAGAMDYGWRRERDGAVVCVACTVIVRPQFSG